MEIAREQENASQELARSLWEQMAAQEYEAQKAALGEQAEMLRRQLTVSDREEEEARAAHRQKTFQLAQLMAEQQEVEATARTFREDMAQSMAAGKAKDKAARLRHLRSAVE